MDKFESNIKNSNKGFALILTLWVLMILSALMLTYSMYVTSNLRNASYIKDKMLSSCYADSALYLTAVSLIPPKKTKKTDSEAQKKAQDQDREMGRFEGGNIDKGDGTDTGTDEKVDPKEVKRCFEKLGKWYVDHKNWTLSKGKMFGKHFDTGVPEIKIVCEVIAEDAKFPINSLVKLKKSPPTISPVAFTDIKNYLKKPATESDEEPSSEPKPNPEISPGATPPPEGTTPPDSEKDKQKYKKVSCIEQLLSVQSIDKKLYDGDKDNPGLKDIATVFSDGKVYINAAERNALAMIPGISEGIASQIVDRLSGNSYLKNFDDLNSITGLSGDDLNKVKKWLSLIPKYYRIIARATVYGITSKAEGIVKVDKGNIEILLINRG